VKELVHHTIEDVGNMNASGKRAEARMSAVGAYDNVVWRVEWSDIISNLVVSTTNPKGTMTNSNLEMIAILLQYIVLEQIAPTQHKSVLMRSNNTPACSWATKMSPKLAIAVRLVRALALRQSICQVAVMTTLYVVRKDNDLADTPSR